jgi:hypothetical protein
MRSLVLAAGSLLAVAVCGCGGGASAVAGDGGAPQDAAPTDGARAEAAPVDSSAPGDAAVPEAGAGEASTGGCSVGDAGSDGGAACYAITCTTGAHSLQQNRDRLLADNAHRRCTDTCTLWAALNQAERYIFLMDTAYFGAPASQLYPPGAGNDETALDHATALYSINGPKAGQGVDLSGRGGNDYNRIYLGFDALGECVMRNFIIANPTKTAGYNEWAKSDDLAGPHAPFTEREMIPWYKGALDFQSEGPQFHHWHQDSDFSQSGINQRLGVCGNTDLSLTEATIAFDSFHNSDPLGDYTSNGGYGWQITSQYAGIDPDWSYMPTACPTTAPVNMDPYGGGTFAGMGPSLDGGGCTSPALGDGGC